jgi:hypothetical protein
VVEQKDVVANDKRSRQKGSRNRTSEGGISEQAEKEKKRIAEDKRGRRRRKSTKQRSRGRRMLML